VFLVTLAVPAMAQPDGGLAALESLGAFTVPSSCFATIGLEHLAPQAP
jgi:hypothetical protein